jgi:hypothetical protein
VRKILSVLVALPALMFVVTGVRWLVAPAGVAPQFGLTLADGLGLSSQVGNMSGFFLTMGLAMLLALATRKRIWFYPPMMLLLFTAAGRIIAWLIHGAALTPMILVELIVAVLLLVASRLLPDRD